MNKQSSLLSAVFQTFSSQLLKKALLPLFALLLMGESAAAQPVLQSWATSTATAPSTTATVGKPADLAVGDLMIVSIASESAVEITATGWTAIQNQFVSSTVRLATFWKFATTDDLVAVTFSFDLGGEVLYSVGISRITGANPGSPINVSAGSSGESGSYIAPSITTTVAHTLVLAFFSNAAPANWTAPEGTTERYDVNQSSTDIRPSNMMASYTRATAGVTGAQTATQVEGQSWVAQQIAIQGPPISEEFSSTSTFTVPAGVNSLTIQAWGGGGAGGAGAGPGSGQSGRSGGGGGGGAYTITTVSPVSGGQTFTVNSGAGGTTSAASGTPSTVVRNSDMETIITANGGGGGMNATGSNGNGGNGGAGGTYSGGNGAVGVNTNGGGGGGSAGTAANGNSGNGINGGAAVTGGGPGGIGSNGAPGSGSPGGIPGGGGGGGRVEGGNGGAGARGEVRITYHCPTYYITSTTATDIQVGNPTEVTLTSSPAGLPVGKYLVTYNLSEPNPATGLTAEMEVTEAGTGIFTTINLPVIGPTTVTVTRIESGECSSFITASNSVEFVVPIQLLFFRGEKDKNTALLTWRTATELNNDYMAVERSTDGRQWEELGRVQGAGTTSTPQDYSFTDEKPLPGINYYRLRQVDYDGAMEYHNVIALDFGADKGEARIVPNPVRERLTLNLSFAPAQDGEVFLIDAQGRVLHRGILPAGSTQWERDLGGLPAGMYFVRIREAERQEVLRFVKE